ncbi:arsenate reductase (glutaredoxin) [Pedobacter sp. KR3-3]|uniref:Arsenate reductase (Glutaredoxin) n=1 Tax=Pedobacter albus TaxID=3113905 RepID=A0ABU7I6A2_9SPHI|nr:arsenate reductase (glutaredoxin) [Pedobacter sp. KR3-3]MEE1945005.1 arsenate reductase (glutaredoxin) [Pedobacter sp. KR3-3]
MITIYHNNSCSKSNAALKALTQCGEPFEIIEYLKDTPSLEELREIIAKLGCKPHDLIRVNEAVYLEKYKGQNLSDEEWLQAMHDNPILIQRPIIVNQDKAVIARSEDSIKAAL